MTAVIAYQSLNSNASTEHDLAASTSQHFLRQAQRTLASMYPSGSGALNYPTNPGVPPHVALYGPPHLLPVASADHMDVANPKKRKRSEADDTNEAAYKKAKLRTLSMVEGKALQIYQMAYREVHEQCDLIVFGELDSSHVDWKTVPSAAGKQQFVSVRPKACNCFSVHGPSSTEFIGEGDGWCAAKCNGVLVVCVHVPNSLAANQSEAARFYKGIKNKLLTSCGSTPDLIIGDTNQPRENFSPQVISDGMDEPFLDAHSAGSAIVPADTWAPNGVTHQGTNSANSKKFDVAIYNPSTVASIQVTYFTQFSATSGQAAAYTDHMGVLVKVEKR